MLANLNIFNIDNTYKTNRRPTDDPTEDLRLRTQKTLDRGPKTEDPRQKTKDRRQKTLDRIPNTDNKNRRPKTKDPR